MGFKVVFCRLSIAFLGFSDLKGITTPLHGIREVDLGKTGDSIVLPYLHSEFVYLTPKT